MAMFKLILTASILLLFVDINAQITSTYDNTTMLTSMGFDGGGLFLNEGYCHSSYLCPNPLESKSKVLPKWDDLNCQCDDACAVYGDCCINARFYDAEATVAARQIWKCINLVEYQGLYMQTSCPASWPADDTRDKCEKGGVLDDGNNLARDPLSMTPVTSLVTRYTYQNFYCAYCSGDVERNIYWIPRIECDDLLYLNSTYGNVTDEFAWSQLVYNNETSQWGIFLDTNTTKLRLNTRMGPPPPPPTHASTSSSHNFVTCRLMVQIPANVVDLVRQCKPWLDDCPTPQWQNQSVRQLCHSYTAATYSQPFNSYRNVHCAICNGVDLTHLSCNQGLLYRNVNPSIFAPSFAFLFDINENSGDIVGTLQRCKTKEEIYDPFFKTCRQMVCANSNYKLRNGRCILLNTEETTTHSETTTTEPTTTSKSPTTTLTTPNTTTTSKTLTTIKLTTPKPTTTSKPLTTIKLHTPKTTTTSKPFTTIKLNTPKTTTTIAVTFNRTTEDDDDEDYQTSVTPPGGHNAVNESNATNFEEFTTISATSVGGQSDCPRFNLSRFHYYYFENGSIYIKEYNRYYAPRDYVAAKDGTISICIPPSINDLDNLYKKKFSVVLAYMTVACLGVSIVCLVFHLAAFTQVPALRNLSGKNLASLCVSLVTAYTTFIISQFQESVSSEVCTSVGVILYYSFLASFFWMNSISYDVWRTLRLATSELRVSSGQQWRKFVIYSAYSWFGSALVVIAAIIVENSENVPRIYKPSFGLVACWFGSRRALLLFFVTPVILIVAVNILMFAMSAHIILSTTRNSAILHPSSKARRNFQLYLRLALIMGVTWVFGIVAGQIDREPVWYIFVLLNGLQGLFIFVSFTCKRKVRLHLMSKLLRRRGHGGYFASANQGGRHPKKFELEGRDSGSGESQSSQTSHLSLTKTGSQVSKSSTDTLY